MAFSSMVKDINRKIILESFWDLTINNLIIPKNA